MNRIHAHPPAFWYAWLKAICLSISVGDVFYAARHDPRTGGTGGAIAAMLSFAALAVPEDLSGRIFNVMLMDGPEGPDDEVEGPITGAADATNRLEKRLVRLETQVAAIIERLNQRDRESGRQAHVLGLCGLIGTIFWALGDRMAAAIRLLFTS